MNDNFKVSVIIPVFNEEKNVEIVYAKLAPILGGYFDYEIIFIDDGSRDQTLEAIKKTNAEDKRVKYLSFSRNFGHQNALVAGLEKSSGDCVISMDGDMQHPPELIPKLIEKWKEGFKIVYTIRKDNSETSFIKRVTTNIFYNLLMKISDVNIPKGAADFRLLDRTVVEIIKNLKESNLFLRGIISWLGFEQCAIEYVPGKRFSGRTKYSLRKMISLALNGLTSFSIKPLRVSIFLGSLISLLSFLYGVYAILMKLFTDKVMAGWTSVLISVLFIGGVQLLMFGIMGEYLGKLFIDSKRRPGYIIKEESFSDIKE